MRRNRQICDVFERTVDVDSNDEVPHSASSMSCSGQIPPRTTCALPWATNIQRGVLQLVGSELHFTPPSPSTLERWRSFTELHQRTEFESHVEVKSPTGHPVAASARAAKTSAFLRVRVLPSGPWGFCRTFPLKLPQPADWGRDPLHAGEPSKSIEEKVVRQQQNYHSHSSSSLVLSTFLRMT